MQHHYETSILSLKATMITSICSLLQPASLTDKGNLRTELDYGHIVRTVLQIRVRPAYFTDEKTGILMPWFWPPALLTAHFKVIYPHLFLLKF